MDQIITSPGFCSWFPNKGVVSERAISSVSECDTMVGRPIVVPQPFPIWNNIMSSTWLILALKDMLSVDMDGVGLVLFSGELYKARL